MGLNKPVHILDVESSVRDIVNMTAVAVLDAIVEEQIRTNNLDRIGKVAENSSAYRSKNC
jgi:malate dehydrogenase (oxaloacetate-decarboxylating)(NADP+)